MKTKDQSMVQSEAIDLIYRDYMRYNPEEGGMHKLLEEQLSKQGNADLRQSTNFVGHVVVSTFILDKKGQRVLLLEGGSIKHHLQPTIHLTDQNESLLDAALQCLQVEVGIDNTEVKYRQAVPGRDYIPFNIDTQVPNSDEEASTTGHTHHVFGYLFIASEALVAKIGADESGKYTWVAWEEFGSRSYFKKVARKIEELSFRKSASHFFDEVFATQNDTNTDEMYCVAVQHILPSTYKFIIYLNNIFNGRLTVLAKPKSIDQSIHDKLTDIGITIQVASRNTKQLEDYVIESGKKHKVIILDIGAYFCEISTKKGLPILGIIEDTENGHQKYLRIQDSMHYPVLSVARSELKKNEDALVGRSILHATDSILRIENRLIEYMDCVVIGYGKIGAGIAAELMKKGIRPVVVEINPVRAIDAIRNGAYLKDIDHAIRHAKVIFCATGNRALSTVDFRKVRSGAFLVSVTSSDDEFDLDYTTSEYEEKETNEYLTKYSNENNYFYLVNKGNAVNFLFNAALDRYIYLVQGAIIAGIGELLSGEFTDNKLRAVTGKKYEEEIAREWLKEFTN